MSHLVISNRKIDNAQYFKSQEELEAYLKISPRKVLLFAFWSETVPKWMLDTFTCYGLHTGPLLDGKGKGGSPIDNLKALGVGITTLCAFEMTEKIDGGRVRVAIPMKLNYPKSVLIQDISSYIPIIIEYLTTDQSTIPEKFRRLENVE